MSKARTLAGTVSTGAILADGTIDAAEIGNLTLPTGGDIVGTTAEQTLTNKTIEDPILTLNGSEGTAGQVPVSQGAGLPPVWGAVAGVISDYQEFTSSGTWTKPAGATWVYVEAIGGGGGGANNTGSTGRPGGSGGEFVSKILLASVCGATETVTVGAGGAGCATGTSSIGNDGGDSTFGSLVQARGGFGGQNTTAHTSLPGASSKITASTILDEMVWPQAGFGGRGSPGKGGNTIFGGAGGGGSATSAAAGGASVYGGAGGSGSAAGGSKAGNGTAPGGGGGASTNDGGGGDGAPGRVRVWCW